MKGNSGARQLLSVAAEKGDSQESFVNLWYMNKSCSSLDTYTCS